MGFVARLFVQTKVILKKKLTRYLRSKRVVRQRKQGNVKKFISSKIVDAISRRKKPAEAKDHTIPGYWEVNLIYWSKNTHFTTFVERQSIFKLLIKINDKDTKTVRSA